MSATTIPAASSIHARRRLVAPFITLVAAGAGLYAGTLVGEPASEIGVLVMLFLVAGCAMAAWTATQPGPDLLVASGRDAFRAELDRARRHRRTFAMARLELAEPAVDRAADGPSGDGIARATIELIGASLRITDRAWLEDGDAVILLPESDRATAEAFAERVRTAAPGRFTDRIAFAVFPHDGLTSGALLDALDRGLRGDARPSPLVRTTVDGSAPGLAVEVGASKESGVG
jgi:hypothetical protein